MAGLLLLDDEQHRDQRTTTDHQTAPVAERNDRWGGMGKKAKKEHDFSEKTLHRQRKRDGIPLAYSVRRKCIMLIYIIL